MRYAITRLNQAVIVLAVKHTGIKEIHITVVLVIIKVREKQRSNQE